MIELSITSIVLLIIMVLVELIIIGVVMNKGVKQVFKANFWKEEAEKSLKAHRKDCEAYEEQIIKLLTQMNKKEKLQ